MSSEGVWGGFRAQKILSRPRTRTVIHMIPIESKAGSTVHLKDGQVLWRQSQHQDQWKNINNGQVGKDHLSWIHIGFAAQTAGRPGIIRTVEAPMGGGSTRGLELLAPAVEGE